MKEILKAAKDAVEVGETARYNHLDCDAGEDKRRRLYVTRKPDILLGYCHNCGESASIYMGGDRYRTDGASVIPKPAKEYVEPTVVEWADKSNIPAAATAWRMKAKLSRTQARAYDIGYDPVNDGIIIPFVGMDSVLKPNGHQLRPLHNRGGAKYVNYVKDESEELGGTIWQAGTKDGTVCIIVEDYVSGIRVAEAGFTAYVNYGTQVKPGKLWQLAKKYNHIIVWLDNDNEVVNKNAQQMYDILHMYKKPAAVVRRQVDKSDPKDFTEAQIKEVVENGFA